MSRKGVVTDKQLREAASSARQSLERLVDSIGDWTPQQEGRRRTSPFREVRGPSDDPPRHWREQALCLTAEGDWFDLPPRMGAGMRKAKAKELAICAACPVLEECRDYALRTRPAHGIFGGLLPVERKRLLKEVSK